MGDEFLRGICRIARVFARVFHVAPSFEKLLFSDVESVAESDGVKLPDVFWDYHHVVGRLVEHHKLVEAVVHEAASRIYGAFQEGVAVGVLFIFGVGYLKIEKPHHINQDNKRDKPAYHIFSFFKIVVFSHFFTIKLSAPRSTRKVSAALEADIITISLTSAKLKYSIVNASRQ